MLRLCTLPRRMPPYGSVPACRTGICMGASLDQHHAKGLLVRSLRRKSATVDGFGERQCVRSQIDNGGVTFAHAHATLGIPQRVRRSLEAGYQTPAFLSSISLVGVGSQASAMTVVRITVVLWDIDEQRRTSRHSSHRGGFALRDVP